MNGIIIVNKPQWLTSHDVVARLRRMLGEKRIGHAGTLDPMAVGVLPVCVGKATRLVEYLGDGAKTYIADICFGIETDSYDKQGNVLAVSSCADLKEQQIIDSVLCQQGEILQVPPMVSALKIDGKPLYKLAREGKSIERKARPVTIYDIKLLQYTAGEHPLLKCEITCSKGTYIRSIAHDAGEILHCGAHLTGLKRTRVSTFTVDKSYSLEQIEEMLGAGDKSFLLSYEAAIGDMPHYTVNDTQLSAALHGNCFKVSESDIDLCTVYDNSGLIGIGHITEGVLYMDKVLRDL